MPTRKQRRREAKSKRHEYEFVYVDDEGNELDEAPEGADLPKPTARRNGTKPQASTQKKPTARGARASRVPQPPSWSRAAKRAAILGVIVFVLFYMGGKGGNRTINALGLAALYTALFVPFTYVIDRFAYQRYQRREQQGGSTPKKPAKR
jgi:hypothetical protein